MIRQLGASIARLIRGKRGNKYANVKPSNQKNTSGQRRARREAARRDR
jgi:hypothetical protein